MTAKIFTILLMVIAVCTSRSAWCEDSIQSSFEVGNVDFGKMDLHKKALISFSQASDIQSLLANEDSFAQIKPMTEKTSIEKYWLRFEVLNTDSEPVEAYITYPYTHIGSMEVYVKDPNGNFNVKFSGGSYPASELEISYRKPTVRVTIQPGINQYYVKIKYSNLKPPYLILHSSKSFFTSSLIDYTLVACCFGAMIFSLIYNFSIYLKLKYSYVLQYLLFVITAIPLLLGFMGVIRFAIPNSNFFVMNNFLTIAMGVINFYFISIFGIKFLNLSDIYSSVSRIKTCLLIAALIGVILSLYESFLGTGLYIAPMFLGLFTVLVTIGTIGAGIASLRRGYTPALYYLISWTPCLLANAGLMLVMHEVFSWIETSDLWSLFGATFQVCALSLALADRIRSETERLHSDLANANSMLQANVEHLDELVEEKTARIRFILENVNIGIIRFGRKGTIEPEYSKATLSILDRKEITGLPIEELLFPDKASETYSVMHSTLTACLGETWFAWEANAHALPREVNLNNNHRLLELDWAPIIIGDNVDGCLIVIRDVTYTRKLEQETRKAMDEVNLIKRISLNGRDRVVDYFQSEMETIKKTKKLAMAMIEHRTGVYDINLSICLRNLHTIKGNARTYGFDEVSGLIHKCESDVKANDNVIAIAGLIKTTLVSLDIFFEKSLEIINRYIPTARQTSAEDYRSAHESLNALEVLWDHVSPTLRSNVVLVANFIKRGIASGLSDIVEPIRQDLPRIAKGLGKIPPSIELAGNPIFLRKEHTHRLRSLLIHLTRNSVDHGIEEPGERANRGKPSQGTITLTTQDGPDYCKMVFEDDGQGLAIKRIYDQALTRGLISPTSSPTIGELADLIFLAGFTSKSESEATEISGRGVGMDAVKDFLSEVKGTISIRFPDPKVGSMNYDDYQGLYVPFQFLIEIPRKICA